MLTLGTLALILAVLALCGNAFLLWRVQKHFDTWDHVTDVIIDQSKDVLNNHANRIAELELSLGGVYTPFGFKRKAKA